MQDGDADFAALVDCDKIVSEIAKKQTGIERLTIGMPDGCDKLHLGRHVWVLSGKMEQASETATAIETAAFVGQHEHDLPLKDIVIDQAAADAGNVLVALHLLELAA